MAQAGRAQGTGRGEAGRRGDEIRSDLWVAVTPRDTGGIDLALTSRVEPYYGEAIRRQVQEVLGALGVAHARVEIDDRGALPFVIAARLEAAVRRSGLPAHGDARPPVSAATPGPAPRQRLRRSRLYLPGDEPKYMVNAGLYAPDAIILDLEDSVHAAAKDAARLLVRNALRVVDFRGAERMVRINQWPGGADDLDVVVRERADMLLVPKVESPEQIREIEERISVVLGGDEADGPPWLMPILETALGIERSFDIARAGARVVALTIGLEDYAADIGVPRSPDGVESSWARKRLVNAARAAGVQAIDSVFGQVDDSEGLRRWCEHSRRLGFEGMGCLHPRQIPIIHAAFNPTAAQIERALQIVAAFEEARAAGRGVVSLGSKMIDPPVVRQSLRIVEQARSLGLVGERDGDG